MSGYDYYPQNDSIFKNKPLLYALQRLPFITVRNQAIDYKNGEKILFLINGKYRKGIGNNWNELLKSVKAKDIYKVELIDDITILAKKQGYKVIINILILNDNIYGTSFTAALLYDQRNNLNRNLDATFLRKKMDFTLSYGSSDDNKKGAYNIEILKNNVSIEKHDFEVKNKSNYNNFDIVTGIRLDSFNDIAMNLSFGLGKTKEFYTNTFNFPTPVSNFSSIYGGTDYDLNFSYTNTKKKKKTKSFSIAYNKSNTQIENKKGFIINKSYDSINNIINKKPIHWVANYNVQFKKTKTTTFEFGIQAYTKKIKEGLGIYTLNTITNSNETELFKNTDSFTVIQNSFNPYWGLRKGITKSKSISIQFNSEIYQINNTNLSLKKIFFLPTASLSMKKIVNQKMSFKISTGFSFNKPNTNYLSPISIRKNPLTNYLGNRFLTPDKSVSLRFELTQNRKIVISNGIDLSYSFNRMNEFEKYNEVTKLIETQLDNNGKVFSIRKYLNLSTLIFKKINVSTYSSISYSRLNNGKANAKFNGLGFSSSNSLNYNLGEQNGGIGFSSFLNGKRFSSQGYSLGTMMYSLYYYKSFFKNKVSVTFDIEQFLQKNRTVKSFSFYNDIQNFSEMIMPFRIVKIWVAYNFSNIKVEKYAASKTASIYGEASTK